MEITWTNELIRLARGGVQGLVALVAALLTAWLATRGIDLDIPVETVTLLIMPIVGLVITALVAQAEKRFPAIGLLNGPRVQPNYLDPEPELDHDPHSVAWSSVEAKTGTSNTAVEDPGGE